MLASAPRSTASGCPKAFDNWQQEEPFVVLLIITLYCKSYKSKNGSVMSARRLKSVNSRRDCSQIDSQRTGEGEPGVLVDCCNEGTDGSAFPSGLRAPLHPARIKVPAERWDVLAANRHTPSPATTKKRCEILIPWPTLCGRREGTPAPSSFWGYSSAPGALSAPTGSFWRMEALGYHETYEPAGQQVARPPDPHCETLVHLPKPGGEPWILDLLTPGAES